MVFVKINIDDNCLNCLSQSIFFSPLTAFWKRSLGNIIVLPFWIFIACMGLVQVCLKKTKACILQRKHICRKLKQNTYCVITSIRDKFVVHCFNNTSSEGEGKKKINASFHSKWKNIYIWHPVSQYHSFHSNHKYHLLARQLPTRRKVRDALRC